MRNLLRFTLLVVILGITNLAFSKEPIDTFEKITDKNQKMELAKTLSLRETVILGSQKADKSGIEKAFAFGLEYLFPRWQEDASTIPSTISIIVNEKLNPDWEKSLVGFFENIEGPQPFLSMEMFLPAFLKYTEEEPNEQKTKVMLLDIIGSRFEGYKELFTLPEHKHFRTEKNFELANQQVNKTLDSLDKIVLDRETPNNVSNSAKVLYSKIRQIYLDENNILPQEFKALKSFQQVRAKTGSVFISDLSRHINLVKSIMPLKGKVFSLFTKKAIVSEGQSLVASIRTQEKVYFAKNNKYTDKWEDISASIDLTNNKYFITPPIITVYGNSFKAVVKGSGEAEGMTVSIDQRGSVVVTGLQ
ncbi:MAG: hypothetical protein ABID32_02710 [Candidatus Omnitrophota bacterium]